MSYILKFPNVLSISLFDIISYYWIVITDVLTCTRHFNVFDFKYCCVVYSNDASYSINYSFVLFLKSLSTK